MKKKGIIVSIVGIVLVSTLTIILISKNSKKYIMYDGMMLAMTLTDTSGNTITITEFPSGTNYRVEVDCGDTATGRWLPEEWKLAVEGIDGNVKCNINFYTRTDSDKLSSIVQTAGTCSNTSYTTKTTCEAAGGTWTTTITNANGYRYSGKTPNNYIWFNNELWRIIGLVPVCTSASSGTCSNRTTSLVKIIRAESIGGLAYDAKSSGDTGLWGNNTLYTLLNTYYYGKQNGTGIAYCYGHKAIAVADCDYREIGISSSNTDYYGKMIEPVYWNIGASDYSATPGTVYGTETAKVTTNQAKIGLMSASDYGYAAVISGYSTSLSSYGTAVITGTNWLYGQGNEWTNIQMSSRTNTALGVSYIGYVSNGNAYFGDAVRPVLYLDAGVYVISGSGTMSDPYMIGM